VPLRFYGAFFKRADKMDSQLSFYLVAENGMTHAYPANDQAQKLCDLAGLQFLTTGAVGSAHLMGFQVVVHSRGKAQSQVRFAARARQMR
jgi:hypothetical protein